MKKRILNLFLVVALGTTITVHASDVNTESVNLPQSTEEIQNEDADNINNISQSAYGIGSENGASAQVYVIQNDGFTTVYTPLEVRNNCSIKSNSGETLNLYTFSKTEKNDGINFELYSYGSEFVKNIKEIYIVAKLNEIPSSISDGAVIASKRSSERYFESRGINVYGYNTDTLKNLPNGTYYLRTFFKDVNNVYSVNGGMFSGSVSDINPRFIIKD